jgi:hypothetical protein
MRKREQSEMVRAKLEHPHLNETNSKGKKDNQRNHRQDNANNGSIPTLIKVGGGWLFVSG